MYLNEPEFSVLRPTNVSLWQSINTQSIKMNHNHSPVNTSSTNKKLDDESNHNRVVLKRQLNSDFVVEYTKRIRFDNDNNNNDDDSTDDYIEWSGDELKMWLAIDAIIEREQSRRKIDQISNNSSPVDDHAIVECKDRKVENEDSEIDWSDGEEGEMLRVIEQYARARIT